MTDATLGEPPWREIERLLTEYGDTRLVPDRLRALREERGWSAAKLVAELAKLEPPVIMSRQTVHKIEARDGRTDVKLSEILGFARVFGVMFADLLLPEGAIAEVDTWLTLERAAKRLSTIAREWELYEDDIATVRRHLVAGSALHARVLALQEQADETLLASFETRERSERKSAAPRSGFVPSLDASRCPEARAAADVLRTDQLEWTLRGGFAHLP